MVAATLFSVMTRGRLMTLALPCCSSAVKRAASAFAPVERAEHQVERRPASGPEAPKPVLTGKSNMKGTGERATPLVPTGAEPSLRPRAADADRAGEVQAGRVPGLRARLVIVAPLHAERARQVARRLYDVGLDQYLRALHVQLVDELRGGVGAVRDVAHDDGVGAGRRR